MAVIYCFETLQSSFPSITTRIIKLTLVIQHERIFTLPQLFFSLFLIFLEDVFIVNSGISDHLRRVII